MSYALGNVHYARLDKGCFRVERVLNGLGYFPVIQGISGRLRELFGIIQLVTAVVSAVFMILEIILIANQELKKERIQQAQKVLEYSWHGIANILRGQLETLPVVNLGFILYDWASGLRWKYDCEGLGLTFTDN